MEQGDLTSGSIVGKFSSKHQRQSSGHGAHCQEESWQKDMHSLSNKGYVGFMPNTFIPTLQDDTEISPSTNASSDSTVICMACMHLGKYQKTSVTLGNTLAKLYINYIAMLTNYFITYAVLHQKARFNISAMH